MKRLLLAGVFAAGLIAPAFSQAAAGAESELRDLIGQYVSAFNKADAPRLAKDFYDVEGVTPQEMETKLAGQFAKLREDEFGKMDIFAVKPCADAPDAARVQVDFAYNYTYGGLMPPGEQTTVFDLRKKDGAWKIVGSTDLKYGQQVVCAR